MPNTREKLIDAEAIARKLKSANCAECNVVRKVQCSACWVEDVLELLECAPTVQNRDIHWATEQAYKNGYEAGKPKWISVKERLPEDNERVLVYHDDGMIRLGINKNGFADVVSNLYLKHNHKTCFSKVTHWMPLPEAPKGE